MDLSSLFSSLNSDPYTNYGNLATGLGGLYGTLASINNNNNINGQVQSALSTNNAALQQQAAALQQQVDQQRANANDQYNRSLADVTSQNAQLQSQIDSGTANLAALSDPNSAYMQQAREAIARKDAASGRNSQYGDREVQLAALLAEQVAKYSPAMQSAITSARNQIATNNSGLASLYNTASNPAQQTQAQQLAAIQSQIAAANAANTTGRQAANSQSNAYAQLLALAGKGLGGLGSLLNGASYPGISTLFQGNQTPSFGSDWNNPGLSIGGGTPASTPFADSTSLGYNYNAGSNPYGYSYNNSYSDWD